MQHDWASSSTAVRDTLGAKPVSRNNLTHQANHALPVIAEMIGCNCNFRSISKNSLSSARKEIVFGALDIGFDVVYRSKFITKCVERRDRDGGTLRLTDLAIKQRSG